MTITAIQNMTNAELRKTLVDIDTAELFGNQTTSEEAVQKIDAMTRDQQEDLYIRFCEENNMLTSDQRAGRTEAEAFINENLGFFNGSAWENEEIPAYFTEDNFSGIFGNNYALPTGWTLEELADVAIDMNKERNL